MRAKWKEFEFEAKMQSEIAASFEDSLVAIGLEIARALGTHGLDRIRAAWELECRREMGFQDRPAAK